MHKIEAMKYTDHLEITNKYKNLSYSFRNYIHLLFFTMYKSLPSIKSWLIWLMEVPKFPIVYIIQSSDLALIIITKFFILLQKNNLHFYLFILFERHGFI